MKLVLLLLFLILSFTLPVLVLLQSKSDKKIVLLFFGMLVYFLTTVSVSFFAQAFKITSYNTVSERLQYVLLLSLMLTLSVFIMSKLAKNIFIKENASGIYAGYSFLNVFVYHMSAYVLLVLVGFYGSSDKLVQMYGQEYAKQLIDYYSNISLISIIALIAELVLTFYILHQIFVKTIGTSSLQSYLIFFVQVFIMYLIQFVSFNTIMALICYGIFALLVSGKINLKERKQKA